MPRTAGSFPNNWESPYSPGALWRRYPVQLFLTVLLILATMFLYGLLLLPSSKSLYTVTYDIQLARKNLGDASYPGSQATLQPLTSLELRDVIHRAHRDGVVQRAVDALGITDRIDQSRISDIDIQAIVEAGEGTTFARVKIVGESAADSERVAQTVGESLLRFVLADTGAPNPDRGQPDPRSSAAELDAVTSRESRTWAAVERSWSSLCSEIEQYDTIAPPTTDSGRVVEPIAETSLEPSAVNPQWIMAERRLQDLRQEQRRLFNSGSPALAERMASLVREAEDRLANTAVFDPRSNAHVADVRKAVGGGVKTPTLNGPQEPTTAETDSAIGKAADENASHNWPAMLAKIQGELANLFDEHKSNRRTLLDQVSQLAQASSPPLVVVGWVERAPVTTAWARGISPRKFLALFGICTVLSGGLGWWLYRVTALERLHDLRELAMSSSIPIVAAVNTGAVRQSRTSTFQRLSAAWTRRGFQLALLLYLFVFFAASLSPEGTWQSFLQSPRQMLGQALTLFSMAG